MKHYAYINKETHMIENVIFWDGETEYASENTHYLVELPVIETPLVGEFPPTGEPPLEKKAIGIGSYYLGGKFINKPS